LNSAIFGGVNSPSRKGRGGGNTIFDKIFDNYFEKTNILYYINNFYLKKINDINSCV
jgi:hypothetical protein